MPIDERPKQPWQVSLAEAAERVERELRGLVRAVDEDVVPEVRRHGSSALRALASKLDRLAGQMEDARRQQPGPPPSAPPRDEP